MEITSLSYSKIASLLRCPRAFEFNYLMKTPVPLKGRMLAGRCYHHALAIAESRMVLLGELITAEEIADSFSNKWQRELQEKRVYDELGEEKVEATIVDYQDDDPGELKDSGIALAQLYLKTVLPGLKIEAIEKRLTADIDGIPFVGYLDLELAGDIVCDHKLSIKRKAQEDNDKKMAQENADKDIQLSAYAMLLGKPITGQFHQAFTIKNTKERRIEIVETRRGEEDIEWFRTLVGDVWRQIQAGIFPCNPLSWTCSPDCPYYLDCRKGWF